MSSSSQRHGGLRPGMKRVAAVFLAAAALSFVLFSLCISYLYYVKGTIQQDSKRNLEELGKHISESLTGNIQTATDALNNLALKLVWNDFSSEEQTLAFLQEQADFWGFHDMAYVDRNGISHHADGALDSLNRTLLSDALKKEDTVYDLLIAGGEDCVIFVTPMAASVREEKGILAVTGTYAVGNWDMLMDIDIFNHQAVTHVVTNSGVVITRNRETEEQERYNFTESLRDASFERGVTLETVRQALRDGERLHTSYSLGGTDYYLSCEPLGFSNWALVFTVPASIVNKAGNNMARSVIIIGVVLSVVFMMVFLLFLFFQSRTKKALWIMAYRDEITGGANKNQFELDAQALLEENIRKYALIYMNIRQFKMINRRFGKKEADRILRHIYEAMTRLISPRECCCRLGADNFVLLLEMDTPDSVSSRLEQFAREQTWQTTTAGVRCPIRLAFGLCEAQPHTNDLTQLIDQANLAMKTLPATGDRCLAAYDASMMELAAREKELTERLLQKEVTEEFYICLQPKVDLRTGTVAGAEALIRWNNPVFGFISPVEFIPLAEKAGIVCQIDWIAFDGVCKALKMWESEGKPLVPISFNLSKAQLSQPNFLDHYRQVIEQYQVPCQYLDFEFTESILYEDTDALREAVSEIHAMGSLCSVDDFGFGYSSLGLLGQFEADTLKLDRSFFLQDARPDSRNNLIVRNVIQLAGSLGMETVAEGVEDQEHVEMLRQFGCGSIQGYYFSKPLPLREFEQFVLERTERSVTK